MADLEVGALLSASVLTLRAAPQAEQAISLRSIQQRRFSLGRRPVMRVFAPTDRSSALALLELPALGGWWLRESAR